MSTVTRNLPGHSVNPSPEMMHMTMHRDDLTEEQKELVDRVVREAIDATLKLFEKEEIDDQPCSR